MALGPFSSDARSVIVKFWKLLQLVEPNLSLHEAVASGNVALVEQLLVDGAHPQAKDEQVCTTAALKSSVN